MGLEIISGVERRRCWSAADKLRIVGIHPASPTFLFR
jgi:hypothetical protein